MYCTYAVTLRHVDIYSMSMVDTAATSYVTASSLACWRPCCVVLVASCPRRRRAPRLDEFIVQWVPGSGQFAAAIAVVLAKSHYTCPNGPDPTRPDRTGPDRTRSYKVRGLCLIGSGRVRLVEFSYLPTGICAGSTVVLRQTCCSWAAGHLLDTWVYHK